jgi:hypothetical protein
VPEEKETLFGLTGWDGNNEKDYHLNGSFRLVDTLAGWIPKLGRVNIVLKNVETEWRRDHFDHIIKAKEGPLKALLDEGYGGDPRPRLFLVVATDGKAKEITDYAFSGPIGAGDQKYLAKFVEAATQHPYGKVAASELRALVASTNPAIAFYGILSLEKSGQCEAEDYATVATDVAEEYVGIALEAAISKFYGNTTAMRAYMERLSAGYDSAQPGRKAVILEAVKLRARARGASEWVTAELERVFPGVAPTSRAVGGGR